MLPFWRMHGRLKSGPAFVLGFVDCFGGEDGFLQIFADGGFAGGSGVGWCGCGESV
jgi:hypothetical protein